MVTTPTTAKGSNELRWNVSMYLVTTPYTAKGNWYKAGIKGGVVGDNTNNGESEER